MPPLKTMLKGSTQSVGTKELTLCHQQLMVVHHTHQRGARDLQIAM